MSDVDASHPEGGEYENPLPEKKEGKGVEDSLARLNRQLPFSDEAEKGLLSCLLQDPGERMVEARQHVPEDAFYHTPNRTIYRVIQMMADKNLPIDPVSVANVLRDMGELDKVGGSAAISELYTFVPIAAHYPYYSRVVLAKLALRKLIAFGAKCIERAHEHGKEEPDEEVGPLVAEMQEEIFAMTATAASGDGGQDYDSVLLDVADKVEAQLANAAVIPADRIPTGFTDIDRRVWGYVRGNLVILAGRPSMGKSALAKDIYGNVARGTGHYREWNDDARWPHRVRKQVVVFNLEMTNIQSGVRDLVGGAGLDLQAMRYGLPLRGALDKLETRLRQIKGAPIRMYDRPGMSIQKMRSICRARKRKHGLDLVVIDYLQLMHSDSKRAQQNRQLEISEISAGLKEMAKELDCVVLALAQLGRGVEERKDKKPLLSDLRESGSIEQDADVVMFVHRPWYYHREGPDDGVAQVIFAKGRDIGMGEADLQFNGHFTTFESKTFNLLSNNEEKKEH